MNRRTFAAQIAGRTTLMDKDIRAAYDAVVWTVDSTTPASKVRARLTTRRSRAR